MASCYIHALDRLPSECKAQQVESRVEIARELRSELLRQRVGEEPGPVTDVEAAPGGVERPVDRLPAKNKPAQVAKGQGRGLRRGPAVETLLYCHWNAVGGLCRRHRG